jgi:hypothetical protein
MAYYIFLKSLKSIEEFRKNLHVKIPPKSPSTNFPSLGKFKIQILIQKIFLLHFRPGYPSRPTRPSAQPAPLAPLLSRRPKPTGQPKPLSPRASLAYLQKYVFFLISRLPSSAPTLSPLADAWTLLVSFFFSTAPPRPQSKILRAASPPRRPLRASDAAEPFPLPPSLLSLIPLQTELLTRLNGFNHHLPPP